MRVRNANARAAPTAPPQRYIRDKQAGYLGEESEAGGKGSRRLMVNARGMVTFSCPPV
jgi:hypothetical protein